MDNHRSVFVSRTRTTGRIFSGNRLVTPIQSLVFRFNGIPVPVSRPMPDPAAYGENQQGCLTGKGIFQRFGNKNRNDHPLVLIPVCQQHVATVCANHVLISRATLAGRGNNSSYFSYTAGAISLPVFEISQQGSKYFRSVILRPKP